MATDPGRQLFKDQVQTHGFSFLDDYLDNILSNAKQDTLIELVKTPGRKRPFAQARFASNLKVAALSFQEEGEREANGFLKHKEPPRAPNVPKDCEPKAVVPVLSSVTPSITMHDSFPPPHTETVELSIIAEDDENAEKSHLSLSHGSLVTHSAIKEQTQRPERQHSTADSKKQSLNIEQVHGMSTVLPPLGLTEVQHNASETLDNGSNDIHSVNDDEGEESYHEDTHEHPPRDLFVEASAKALQLINTVEPPPVASNLHDECTIETTAPVRDPDLAPSSPKNKIDTSIFPPLPAVAPFRKSMRTIPDNTSNIISQSAVTPGAAIVGKRTSWLQKARQAKAMELAGRTTMASLNNSSLLQSSVSSSTTIAKRKSTEMHAAELTEEEHERHHKAAKNAEGDSAPTKGNIGSKEDDTGVIDRPTQAVVSPFPPKEVMVIDEDGMLDRLRKTVEGLGAHVGKGKSLGGSAAANALAEARAAAEARVAERNIKEGKQTTRICDGIADKPHTGREVDHHPSVKATELAGKDLGQVTLVESASTTIKEIPTLKGRTSDQCSDRSLLLEHAKPLETQSSASLLQAPIFVPPPGPVFNKPPPVFIPPAKPQTSTQANSLYDPQPTSSSKPDSGILRLEPSTSAVVSVPVQPAPGSQDSRLGAFDNHSNSPIWTVGSQYEDYTNPEHVICDEDDSWPIDEKLAEGVEWTYGNTKEDSLTWSTAHSQPNDTENLSAVVFRPGPTQTHSRGPIQKLVSPVPSCKEVDMERPESDIQSDGGESEEDAVIQNPGTSTISLVESQITRSQSQMSMSSSVSSQSQPSQGGFFGQATKLFSNIMGSGKKGKPEVQKVLQKAAQQEEADKKATRLKEMENRRQLAIQRKAEEEKARMLEQEKKTKEESERRKREREEHTEKRPLKAQNSRKVSRRKYSNSPGENPWQEDDNTKKRKIEEKKVEIKKYMVSVNPPKSAIKPATKMPSALSSSTAYNSSLNTNAAMVAKAVKSSTPVNAASKGKAKAKVKPIDVEDDVHPSHIVQTQMAARAKAQLQAAKHESAPNVPSENIELPEINSEYSDSEDENRPRTFDLPEWAQSPELRLALEQQSTINPDDIFGAIQPLKMEELFKTRSSRFRARTSSANWTGTDRLTAEEEREYVRRMGFK
ncbi:hypothetical protein AMATHDRAFT_45 [Amanita thiersii Skay4041]|uniref:Inner centromere protein ARK-binding domain-containing protein n=1 Tax=Amanita thiersii Skay4041 TaxID=703135 RepID=A0A2A9NU12_9AGAR|nr:hypothetical protein AMATHDRAFT_45 [Amanita thiersii Skay4041]